MSSLKDLTTNFSKLDKFGGVDFCRWQKKIHFLLTTLKVVYVISTARPPEANEVEEEPLESTRERMKWDNDDYICRGYILNGMSDALFDIYQHVETAKELWDTLENKYMSEDAFSKKFLVSQFNNYKMVEGRSIMDQFHEIQRIVSRFVQHKILMDETFIVSSIIDKLPSSWKDSKWSLKHKKEDMSLEELVNHLRVEQEFRMQDESKEPSTQDGKINVVEHGESSKPHKGQYNDKKRPYDDGKKKKGFQ
uniref:Zinc finger, CCHC-type n=1 Tax=Nicotiana tabacum TaxID=4097 RepID=A0A1S4CWN7_TOBAC